MNESFLSKRILGCLLFAASAVLASAAPKCDEIVSDVRSAIFADRAKTLMVVEDALVINETCACEIVRTAIQASNADADLVRQIVQTAIAVAPKMAPVINQCADLEEAALSPVATTSGKGAKDVLPVAPKEPVLVATPVTPDFYTIPADIRGIYLMTPGGVGLITRTVTEKEDCKCKRIVSNRPVSPSRAVASVR